MKTVYPREMVAHLWAHESQEHARNATRSFWFNHKVIYSYSTPIAMLHHTPLGRVVLVTSDGYSMTTKSKHLSAVRHAYHGVVARSFTVPYVGTDGGQAPRMGYLRSEAWPLECAANVEHLVDEYRQLAGRIRRARDSIHTSEESVRGALEGAATIVRDYCEAFKLDPPALDPADDARVIWRAREIRAERNANPATAARREREREQREARKAAKLARERATRHEREAKAREVWRAGALAYFRLSDERGGALLRYNVERGEVQTSWGAQIPADDARRAFPLIARARERGVAWDGRAERAGGLGGITLGSFALTSIGADGSIVAGCHVIHWEEIEACARALGLIDKQE